MTPEEMLSLLSSRKGPLAFAGALCELDEGTRKKLCKTIQNVYREARKEEQAGWERTSQRGSLARLAMLACCPWSQAKRVHGRSWQVDSDHWSLAIIKILSHRRPDWATDWVNLQLENEEAAWRCILNWQQIRELVKSGVIQRPTANGYVTLMAGIDLGYRQTFDEAILDDDMLEHDIWRLFEVQTPAISSLRAIKEIDRDAWTARIHEPMRQENRRWVGGGGWPRIIFHLAETGRVDRGRLIDALLRGFWQDFNNQFRSALTRFHDLIQPTDDEIAGRQATYRELLRCNYGPAVGLAIKSLAKLQAANRLDAAEFFQSVPDVFSIASKTQPASALTLIQRVAKNADEHRAAAAAAVAAALNHESPDIQEKAVAILAKWKAADDSMDLSQAVASATMIGPQHRRSLESLSQESADVGDSVGPDQWATDPAQLDARARAVVRRLTAIESPICDLCSLAGLEDSLAKADLPDPFDPISTSPMLSGVDPIEPIRTVDELIDVTAQVIALAAEPEDTERVIDAIFRIGKQRPDNFDAKTEGVRTIIEAFFESFADHHSVAPVWQMHAWRLMIGRWLGIPNLSRITQPAASAQVKFGLGSLLKMFAPQDVEATVRQHVEASLRQVTASMKERLTPLDWKFAELFERLDRDEYGPVLSTPTHKSGWIDPRVFVHRLRSLDQNGIKVGERDFIGGLLRLAPDFREQALADTAGLPWPQRRIVRYALGADETLSKKDRPQADQWLAAGRARVPGGQLADLAILNLSVQEPDGITPATYKLNHNIDPTELKYSRFAMGHHARGVEVAPDRPGKDCCQTRPTVALAARALSGNHMMFLEDAQQFQLSSIAPANVDATLAVAANQLLCRIDDKGSIFEPINGLLSPLMDVDRGWTDIARVTLWLGLLSRDDQARGIAIDALIEAIGDGRADPASLSETLLVIATGNWIKRNRLADALREVARTSVLAERVVAEILDVLIASWETLPRDGHHVLSLQVELLTNLQCELSEPARDVLSSVKGNGKAAKLAKRLCVLKSQTPSPTMRLAAVEAAEGRIARAERIAQHIRTSRPP